MSTTKVPASRMVNHDIGSYCFRNKIINGNFDIWQRNTSQTTTGYGSADRWKVDVLSNFTVAQQPAYQQYGTFALNLINNTSTNDVVIAQTLESTQITSLVGKGVVLSFQGNSSSGTQVITAFLQKSVTANNSAATNWITIATATFNLTPTTTNTPTYTLTGQIPNDSSALGLRVVFRATNITNSIGLWAVQLEVGPTDTPFEYRPIGVELALCQRYFCREGTMVGGLTTLLNRAMCYTGSNAAFFSNKYPVTMRSLPRVLANLDITDGTTFIYDSTTNTQTRTTGGLNPATTDRFLVFQYTSMVAGQFIDLNGYTADAEL